MPPASLGESETNGITRLSSYQRSRRPQVFAPLARLLGLYSIKEELEALSFKHSQPAAHQVRLGNWVQNVYEH